MLIKRITVSLLFLGVMLGYGVREARAVDIVFIDSNTATYQPGDDALKSYMELLGYSVTYLDDDKAKADMQAACLIAKVVFVSESCDSKKVRDKITGVAVPMIITESWAWDEMGLTKGGGGGQNVTSPTVNIVAPDHPMAAHLSGTVTVYSDVTGTPRGAARMANGLAGPAATVIARAKLPDGVTYDIIYYYPKGAALPAAPLDSPPSPQVAADLRICLGFDEQSYLLWNQNAYDLLEAAIRFAIGDAPGPADVPLDSALSWKAGSGAVTYDVYLGSNRDDVKMASKTDPKGLLLSQAQDANTFDPAGLFEYGKVYYWRVDQVKTADATLAKGAVWRFTAETYAYPIASAIKATASSSMGGDMGPAKTADGSGLNADGLHGTDVTTMWLSEGKDDKAWIQYEFDRVYKLHQMWVWNFNQDVEQATGFGCKEVAVEVSTDGITWTSVAGVPQFVQAPGTNGYAHDTTVAMAGALARFVRLTVKSTWGAGQCGLSEVKFFYVPVVAYGPQPASGGTAVSVTTTLNWRPGREAASHDLVMSTDSAAVAAGTVAVKSLTGHSLNLSSLSPEYGRTYYWRVNEVNDAAAHKVWSGDVWSFTTIGYGVVDDFEAYDDACNRVFFSWIDGYGHSGSTDCGVSPSQGNLTGSTVGNISAPFAERTIVRSGKQSMPFEYDNSKAPFYSETGREWSSVQAWTGGGVNALSVHFWGKPTSFEETPAGQIVMNGIGSDIFKTDDQFRYLYKTLTGNGTIIARVDGVADAHPWSLAGVMIREGTATGSPFAGVFLSAANGVRFRVRTKANSDVVTDTNFVTPEQVALRSPVWVKLERTNSDFKAYYSQDGKNWTLMVFSPQSVLMASTVTVGLAVCSHNASIPTLGRFSNVTTTGTGAWQMAEIGATQPVGNAPDAFYVVVQDSAGKSKTVTYPDRTAICAGAWQEWNIPLTEFTSAGVNILSVKKVIIGVGDRTSPQASGAGKLYIDDLQLIRTE